MPLFELPDFFVRSILAIGGKVHEPAVSASRGSLLGMLIPRPHPDSLNPKLHFNKTPGVSFRKRRCGEGCSTGRKEGCKHIFLQTSTASSAREHGFPNSS